MWAATLLTALPAIPTLIATSQKSETRAHNQAAKSSSVTAYPKHVLRISCWQGMHALCDDDDVPFQCCPLVDAIGRILWQQLSCGVSSLSTVHTTLSVCTIVPLTHSLMHANGVQMRCYAWMNHQRATSIELAPFRDAAPWTQHCTKADAKEAMHVLLCREHNLNWQLKRILLCSLWNQEQRITMK